MESARIPTYSICNLIEHRHIDDFAVLDLKSFITDREHVVSEAHRHSFYQILYVTAGSGEHMIDFQTFSVAKGNIFFLSPGQVHRWHFNEDIEGVVINFHEQFLADFMARRDYLKSFSFFLGNGTYSRVDIGDSYDAALEVLRKIQKEFNACMDCSIDLIRIYLLEFLILANRRVNMIEIPLYQSKHSFYLFRNFEKLVEHHYKEKRLPKEYAEMLFVTPNHLNALCVKTKGISAGELIRDRVLLEAKRLLVNSSLSVCEIAYQLNFKDNSYFSRFFKRYVGQTPDDFRNKV